MGGASSSGARTVLVLGATGGTGTGRSCARVVQRAEEGGFDLAPYAALRRWFARIEARPAYLLIDQVPG